MKIEKIHIYFCIAQVIIIFTLFEPLINVIAYYSIDWFYSITFFIIGVITLIYYFIKKFNLIYKLLSVLNIVPFLILFLFGRFGASSFLVMINVIFMFVSSLYLYWKPKKHIS